MTFVAFHSDVLAFKQVSGFLVVESLGVPLDKGEVFAIVFGVATGALLTGSRRNVIGRVEPLTSRNAVGDFGVTFHAFEGRLAAKLVTAGAVGRSIQRLVRPRQRAGRYLGGAHTTE